MKSIMRVAATALLLAGMGSLLVAGTENCIPGVPCGVPEIDGATASTAIAFLGGAVLLLRNRKK